MISITILPTAITCSKIFLMLSKTISMLFKSTAKTANATTIWATPIAFRNSSKWPLSHSKTRSVWINRILRHIIIWAILCWFWMNMNRLLLNLKRRLNFRMVRTEIGCIILANYIIREKTTRIQKGFSKCSLSWTIKIWMQGNILKIFINSKVYRIKYNSNNWL